MRYIQRMTYDIGIRFWQGVGRVGYEETNSNSDTYNFVMSSDGRLIGNNTRRLYFKVTVPLKLEAVYSIQFIYCDTLVNSPGKLFFAPQSSEKEDVIPCNT